MIRQYETTFILDAHFSNEEIEKAVSKYTDLIGKHKGHVKLIDRWGKRRLAYEVNKKQYGYYIYIRFEAEGTVVGALEKDFKLDDDILRYLVLRVPKVVINEESRKAAAKSEAEKREDEPVETATDTAKSKESEASNNTGEAESSASDTEEMKTVDQTSSSNETEETEESEKTASSES